MTTDAARESELMRAGFPYRNKPSLRAQRIGLRQWWIVSVPVWIEDQSRLLGGFYRWQDTACRTWGDGLRVIDRWRRRLEPTGRSVEQ